MDKQARYHILGLETLEDRIYKVAAASLLGTELGKEATTYRVKSRPITAADNIAQTAIEVQPGVRSVPELMQHYEQLPGTRGKVILKKDFFEAIRGFTNKLPVRKIR